MSKFHRNLLAGLGVFAALWLAIVLLELRTIVTFDHGLARGLNSLVGQSEALDLALLFATQKTGHYTGAALVAVGAVLLCRRAGRRGPSSHGLFLLYLAVIASAAFLLVESLDHYIRRAGPGGEIAGFRSVGALLEMRFQPSRSTTFPDERSSILSAVWFILFFRFGSRALWLGPPLILLGLADVAAGESWPTDLLGGFMGGWLMAALLYGLRVNQAYSWAEAHAGTLAGGAVARVLRLPRRRRALVGSPHEGSGRRRARPPRRLARHLRPHDVELLRASWGFTHVSPLARPHKGKLYPILADGQRYAYKISRRHGDQAASLAQALAQVESLRLTGVIRAPRIVPPASGGLLVQDGRRAAYLMEWASGTPVDVGSLEEVKHLLRTLATLHRSTVHEAQRSAAEPFILQDAASARLAARCLARARPDSWLGLVPGNAETSPAGRVLGQCLQSEAFARVAAAYAQQECALHAPCLIHGDTHPMNFLLGEDGAITVLDFDRLREGFAVADLAGLLLRVGRKHLWKLEAIEEAMASYEEVRPLASWERCLLLSLLVLPRPLRRARLNPKFSLEGDLPKLAREALREGAPDAPRPRFLAGYCQRHQLDLALLFLGPDALNWADEPTGSS